MNLESWKVDTSNKQEGVVYVCVYLCVCACSVRVCLESLLAVQVPDEVTKRLADKTKPTWVCTLVPADA